MAKTSKRVAKIASEMLRKPVTRKKEKAVAGSDLRQASRKPAKKR